MIEPISPIPEDELAAVAVAITACWNERPEAKAVAPAWRRAMRTESVEPFQR